MSRFLGPSRSLLMCILFSSVMPLFATSAKAANLPICARGDNACLTTAYFLKLNKVFSSLYLMQGNIAIMYAEISQIKDANAHKIATNSKVIAARIKVLQVPFDSTIADLNEFLQTNESSFNEDFFKNAKSQILFLRGLAMGSKK